MQIGKGGKVLESQFGESVEEHCTIPEAAEVVNP